MMPEVYQMHPEVHFLHIEAEKRHPEVKKRPKVEPTPPFGHPSDGGDEIQLRI